MASFDTQPISGIGPFALGVTVGGLLRRFDYSPLQLNASPTTPTDDPPTVEDVQPPPGDDLPPEAVVTFKVRDAVGLRRVLVFVRSASTYEVAFDGLNFGPRYADASSRAPLTDGWTFELRRRNGWPKGSVSVEVLPVDTAGQFDA